jgi:glycosyltransferase involved in cell wall biosynthesis
VKPIRAILWIMPDPPQNPGTGGTLRTYWVIRSVRESLPGVRHYGIALDDVRFPDGFERGRSLFDELLVIRGGSPFQQAERASARIHSSLAPRELADGRSWWRYGLRDLLARSAEFLLDHRDVDVVHIDHLQLAPLLPRLRRFTSAPFAMTAHNTYTLLANGDAGPARTPARRLARRVLGAATLAANLTPFAWYEGTRGVAVSALSKLLGRRTIARRSRGVALAMDAWAVAKADHVFCMSEAEVALVRELGAPATLAPNGANAKDLAEVSEAHALRKPRAASELEYTFVGHGSYLPYRAACDLMVQAFADHPDLGRLRLVGHTMAEAARALPAFGRCRNVTVVDGPRDVRPHLAEADAALMPIFAGSGTRLKVVEAVFAGLPLVASRKAVEGLDLDPAEDCALIDAPTAAGVAAAIRQFTERREHFVARSRALRDRWLAKYDWAAIGSGVAGALCELAARGSDSAEARGPK